MADILLKKVKGRIQVYAPYNPDFIVLAHDLDGRYRKRTRMWSFKLHQYPDVLLAVRAVFGSDVLEPKA